MIDDAAAQDRRRPLAGLAAMVSTIALVTGLALLSFRDDFDFSVPVTVLVPLGGRRR